MTDEHLITFLGSHRRVGRRGSARGLKEVDNSLSLLEGKSSKRGSTSYSFHEVKYDKIVFLDHLPFHKIALIFPI